MIFRTFLFSLLLPLSRPRPARSIRVRRDERHPVSSLVNVGTALPGDTLATRFHVRNIGEGPAS